MRWVMPVGIFLGLASILTGVRWVPEGERDGGVTRDP
jgi:hypothetical protein